MTEPTEGHEADEPQPTQPLAHDETPAGPSPAPEGPTAHQTPAGPPPGSDSPTAHQAPAGPPPPPTAQWSATGPTPEQAAAKDRTRRRVRAGVLFGGVALIGAIVGGVAVAAVGWATHVPEHGIAQERVYGDGHGRPGHGGQGGGRQGFQTITGTVVSVQNNSITVTAANGQQVTDTTTPQTVVRGSKTTLTDLKPGDHVTLRLNRSGQVQGIMVR